MYLNKLKDLTICLRNLEKIQTVVPHAIHIIQHMKTVMKFQLQDFEFYRLGNSEEECPPIVSVYRKQITPQVTMFMRDEDANLMKTALHEIIDWKICNHFYCIPTQQVPILKDVIVRHRAKVAKDTHFITVRCENMNTLSDITQSDVSKVRQLNEEDVHLIHSHWVYKFGKDSEETVRQCIDMGAGYGLCLDDKLVSWVMLLYRGDIGLWHTLPEARNAGCAAVVTNITCRHIFRLGLSPIIGRIEHGNKAALKSIKTTGFEKTSIETSDIITCPQ